MMHIALGNELNKDKLQKSIDKFGFAPEQNLFYYSNFQPQDNESIIFYFDNNKLLLTYYNSKLNLWTLFPSGILAPQGETLELFLDFSRYCINELKAKKVVAEFDSGLLVKLKRILIEKKHDLRISRVSYIYHWPIINLERWDASLGDSSMYRLRKIKKNFETHNRIRVVQSAELGRELLKGIVHEWKSGRRGKDKALQNQYMRFIDSGFEGTDYAKSICVNGAPCSISAGWKIPNSNSFYLSVMLHNYRIKNIGEVMYLYSFNDLKAMKIDSVNLGGSNANLLSFKEKFKPHQIYRTYEFSVAQDK